MKVLLVRHAKAEPRPRSGLSRQRDERRRLTPGGRKDMAKVAKGLRRLVPAIDVLATSPLTRARETAEVLARRYDHDDIADVAALSPGSEPQALVEWLRGQRKGALIVLVGHEPDLGGFAGYLLTGRRETFLPLKKGGACLIDLADGPAAGKGRLEWLLPPGALRKLA